MLDEPCDMYLRIELGRTSPGVLPGYKPQPQCHLRNRTGLREGDCLFACTMLECATGAMGGYPIAVLTELLAAIGARPLHSRTIARSGFAAFNGLAHVFDPPTPTQRALMRVTTPAAPKTGVVDDRETEFESIVHVVPMGKGAPCLFKLAQTPPSLYRAS